MLLVLSVRLAATIHYYLQAFAPTNMLLRQLRTRGGLKWAIPAVLLIVPTYLFAAAITPPSSPTEDQAGSTSSR